MASTKREFSTEDEPEREGKKSKVDHTVPDVLGPNLQKRRVVLNPADCNLDFDSEENGLKGSALYQEGFAYCWSGARANVGITGGKYCFGCKIISAQPVTMEDTALDQQHVCRLGISRGDDAVGNLGETEHSFGFGGTGKFSIAGKYSDFGDKFGVGDTIVCAVDLESKPLATIGFAKNGKWLGIAKQFDAGKKGLGLGLVDSQVRERYWELAVFPHILIKNVVVLMCFSIEEGLAPVEDYKPWASSLDDGKAVLGPTFYEMKVCEVMMMVGLPASGKTTWAEKWVKDHPEKRYVLLGTNLILDQMKVPGLFRKHNYGERFERLMGQANVMFDTLLTRAARTPRNYIIDQTNVFKSARKRKLRPFANFQKTAVVVFPKPEELKIRADKRFKEMGKEVPADAVKNMLANYVLPLSKDMPGSDDPFDEVMFVELDRVEAQKHLDEMKHALGSALMPNLQVNCSTYSCESSIQASARPSMTNQGTLSVGSGHWPSSYSPTPQLNHGFHIPNQVNLAYQGAGSCSEAYPGYQNYPIPRASTPYGYNSNIERSCLPRDSIHYSECYGTSPGGRTNPYQSYAVVDPYGKPSSVIDSYRTSMIEPSPMGSLRTSSLPHSTVGGQFNPIGGPQADMQAPRAPMISPSVQASTYGSPYRALPMGHSFGNFPADQQHSERNVPYYPRYH